MAVFTAVANDWWIVSTRGATFDPSVPTTDLSVVPNHVDMISSDDIAFQAKFLLAAAGFGHLVLDAALRAVAARPQSSKSGLLSSVHAD